MNVDRKRRKFLIAGIIILLTILILLVIFINLFRIKAIHINSGDYYTEEEIKNRLFTKKADSYSPFLYLRYKLGRLPDIPYVEEVDIEFNSINEITVYIYDKAIIGCIEQMGKYLYFDKDGIVAESADEKREGIPEISGLEFDRIILNEKLKIQKEAVYDTILNITMLLFKEEAYRSEFPVERVIFSENFDVTLEVAGCKVLLGKRDKYDEQLLNLRSILKSAAGKKLIINMKKYSEDNREVTAVPYENN